MESVIESGICLWLGILSERIFVENKFKTGKNFNCDKIKQ